jgi:hypothetical protein
MTYRFNSGLPYWSARVRERSISVAKSCADQSQGSRRTHRSTIIASALSVEVSSDLACLAERIEA